MEHVKTNSGSHWYLDSGNCTRCTCPTFNTNWSGKPVVTVIFWLYVTGLAVSLIVLSGSHVRLAKFLSGPFPEFIGWVILVVFLFIYPVFLRSLIREDRNLKRKITKTFLVDSCMTVQQQRDFKRVFGSEYNYLPGEIIERACTLRTSKYISLPILEGLRRIKVKGYGTTSRDFTSMERDVMLDLELVKEWTVSKNVVYKLTKTGKLQYQVCKKLKRI